MPEQDTVKAPEPFTADATKRLLDAMIRETQQSRTAAAITGLYAWLICVVPIVLIVVFLLVPILAILMKWARLCFGWAVG